MSTYIANAFSLQMLDFKIQQKFEIEIVSISVEQVRHILSNGFISCVGHADTARIIGGILGEEIPVNRVSLSISPGDMLVVAQYSGSRLPEGAISLPEGAEIRWRLVTHLRW